MIPTRLRLDWILAWVIALACVTWATSTRAAERYGVVSLDLRPSTGSEAPTHLCVVSQSRGPRTRHLLQDLVIVEPHAGDDNLGLRVRPEAWGNAELPDKTCSDGNASVCEARVSLPAGIASTEPLHVACTDDALLATPDTKAEIRILFVLLEHLGGSPPAIESLRLAGGIATVGVTANLDGVVVTARSLGGHYLPDGTGRSYRESEASPTNKVVTLPITPRCEWFDLALPRSQMTAKDSARMHVWVHGQPLDVDRCTRSRGNGDVSVRIPKAPPGGGSIDLEIRGQANAPPARFGARWNTDWPQAPVPLHATQVHFTWERPACIYPDDVCPEASLTDSGTVCSVEPSERGCHYSCPGTQVSATALDLPLGITFEKSNPKQRWTDIVGRNGQILTRYVPGEEVFLTANLARWRTDIPGNRIEQVDIYLDDGSVRRYPVSHVNEVRVPVPRASCEPIRYRPVGQRVYDEGVATIRDGTIEFGPPERTARVITFNLMVAAGGGPAWTRNDFDGSRVFFTGVGQLAMQFRPRKPRWSRVAAELRLVVTGGQWGFAEKYELEDDSVPVDPEDPLIEESFRKLPWMRVMGEPGVQYDATHRFSIGFGFGFGASFPIRRPDALTSERFNFVTSPNFDLRLQIRPWISIVGQIRGIIEETIEVSTNLNGRVQREYAFSLINMAGLAFTF